MSWSPDFVVSDVDGTLLTSRERVSPRTRDAIRGLSAMGIPFTIASGRPARWLLPVLEQLPTRPVCVCANGAVIYDSAEDRIVRSWELSPAVLGQVVGAITAGLPASGTSNSDATPAPISFAVERAGSSAFDAEEGALFAVSDSYDHAWLSDEHAVETMEQLVASPAVKLLVRGAGLGSRELYEMVRPHVDPELAEVTFSWGGGLVEISAPEVSKRSALEWIVADQRVAARDVLAFGDMPNDVEMLRWAGHGVAMGNAAPEAIEVADEVTTSHDDDGVALVLERYLI